MNIFVVVLGVFIANCVCAQRTVVTRHPARPALSAESRFKPSWESDFYDQYHVIRATVQLTFAHRSKTPAQ